MHMMHMLGIISLVFFISMFLMCFFRDRLKNNLVNILFIAINTVFIFCWNLAGYEVGWIKGGLMVFDNISPYIATVITLCVILNDKVKDFAYSAIAFLAFGMFLAMFISPEHEYLFNFSHEVRFIHVTEAACHLIMALYGFYLILSEKVELTLKSLAKSVIFMFSTVAFGVFLNLHFGFRYFGMDMHGNYSIYFLDIFNSFGATLAAYLFGILAVLLLGFAVGLGLDRFTKSKKTENK